MGEACAAFLKAAFGTEKDFARSDVAQCLASTLETMQKPGGLELAIRVGSGEKPLRKPKFKEIGSIKPEQKGLNFYGKVVKATEPADDMSLVYLGDSSGTVTLKVPTAKAS